MPPIFKNTTVGREDIGAFMRAYALKHGLLPRPRRTLIGSYFGEKILLATPLVKWYLHHGLEISEIYTVVEYQPKTCFRDFGKTVSDARRQGDLDKDSNILAETMKLLGNSFYGKTLTNVSSYRDIRYVSPDEADALINNGLFKNLNELDDDVVEVEMAKRKITWALPCQIGFFVYQYAKMRMLEFHYDFIDRYIRRKNYQLCHMDTDSLYLVLAKATIERAVRKRLRKSFYDEFHKWFPAKTCDAHRAAFVESKTRKTKTTVPQVCRDCLARAQFDKRTPGLFKTEFEGDGVLALCSKTYFCFGEKTDKKSHKGLSHAQNSITRECFARVLDSREAAGGTNVGFRTNSITMYTYQQYRNSLSFFYIKRRVSSDGVTTRPLKI